MSNLKHFTNGIIKENPTFVLVLGTCPVLAITTTGFNGFGMGMATAMVLVLSNIFISILKNYIPDKVRIAVFITIIATCVSVVELVMKAFTPDLYKALGIFIPLIVVNCLVLGRAEAFAQKKGVFASALDGLGMGIGFTISLTLISIVREILGNGSFFTIPIIPAGAHPMLLFILPPGAFLTFGLLFAVMNALKRKFKI
ncbi:MAG: electron transport complex subunit E [Bacteroidota bacterium]|nr:electron transport complex subunit E [Bacteroidota bacterium]